MKGKMRYLIILILAVSLAVAAVCAAFSSKKETEGPVFTGSTQTQSNSPEETTDTAEQEEQEKPADQTEAKQSATAEDLHTDTNGATDDVDLGTGGLPVMPLR